MSKEVTLGNLLAILIPVFIGIFIWGKNVETRLTEHAIRIENVERTNGKVEAKLDNISRDITRILVELQNKVDEE